LRNKIDVNLILEDLRSGLGDVPIMEKHHLSPRLYELILKTLRESGRISSGEYTAAGSPSSAAVKSHGRRSSPRHCLLFRIPVSDAHDTDLKGVLVDITERGFQLSGFRADVGSVRRFLIESADLQVHEPITLDAVCRWVRQEHPSGELMAGFEVTEISRHCLHELRTIWSKLAIIDDSAFPSDSRP
jgi:hypothetical protein